MFDKVSFIEISEDNDGQRLDNFLLTRLKGVPKSHVYQLIRKGEIRINKKRADAKDRLSTGDVIRLAPIRVAEPNAPVPISNNMRDLLKSCVLFENDYLLILNKPAGLAVHGGSAVSAGLIELARQVWVDVKQLELVHRLDRDTSGCIVLAKKTQVLKAMQQLFKNDGLQKIYWALVNDYWPAKLKLLDAPLRKYILQSGERMVKVERGGKEAETQVRVKQRLKACTLLEITLKTGRTHQIRVHTQHAGFPVLGDHKYGDKQVNADLAKQGMRRMFLHAHSLKFADPLNGQLIEVTAPLDIPWQEALDKLK